MSASFSRRVFLPAAAAAWPLFAQKQPPLLSDPYWSDLTRLMNSAPVPGAAIGVIREFQPAWTLPLGVLEAGSGRRVDSSSLFHAASLTKQVTAYAAFALRTAGKLDFDRTLVSYVDDLPGPAARTVTIRHVLSHTSGFPNWRWVEKGKPAPPLSPAFRPGSRYQYSGEGFFYLQRAMEEVTGQSIGELVQELVFEPLGMKSSTLVWNPETLAATALPHNSRGEARKDWDRPARELFEYAAKAGKTPRELKYADCVAAKQASGDAVLPNGLLPNAASSLVTCADDYARFLCSAMRNRAIAEQQVRINEFLGWGLGWALERWQDRSYVWQWGDNPGFKNFVLADPVRGDAVFVFTNGDGGARVYDRALVRITGHDHPALFWL